MEKLFDLLVKTQRAQCLQGERRSFIYRDEAEWGAVECGDGHEVLQQMIRITFTLFSAYNYGISKTHSDQKYNKNKKTSISKINLNILGDFYVEIQV